MLRDATLSISAAAVAASLILFALMPAADLAMAQDVEAAPAVTAPDSVDPADPITEEVDAEQATGEDAEEPGDEPAEVDAEPTAEETPAAEEAETEAVAEPGDWRSSGWLILLVVLGVIVLPFVIGRGLAKSWRVPDYQTKITVILFAAIASIAITLTGWPPKLGIDLSGGVILVYEFAEIESEDGEEVDEDGQPIANGPTQPSGIDVGKLVQAISRRVNPGGVKEVTIRPYGERQIEVVIPEADVEETARIKRKISSAGTLEFRILANQIDHEKIIERALELDGQKLRDANGKLEARWVPLAVDQAADFSTHGDIVLRRETAHGQELTEVLVAIDAFNVTGDYLIQATPGFGSSGGPAVNFRFNSLGGQLFGGLTGENQPQEGQEEFKRRLGIVLDGYLQSAPNINAVIFERGVIEGKFTSQQVKDLVDILNAGKLPAKLSEQPISELQTGPTLGRDTVERGKWAIMVSMGLVLVFMLVYYRFAGLLSCVALVMNLFLILGIMIMIKAAFSLPGLAGLVLTVGMAVDANVLIFERIREELARDATLRMAIRNGFARATTTIVDANLTTLIVATVLYWIGREQIKGFAVTLWLGVVMSMFTAIYCSRVWFDIAERKKWITKLNMMHLIGHTNINFIGMRRFAGMASVGCILIGMIAVFDRGSALFDIDFTGGVSVQALFTESQETGAIRDKLGPLLRDLSVQDVNTIEDPEEGRRFKITTAGLKDATEEMPPDEVLAKVEARIQEAFPGVLAHYAMQFSIVPNDASEPPAEAQGRRDLPSDTLLASTDPSAVLLAQADTTPESDETSDEPGAVKTVAQLTFTHPVGFSTLEEMLNEQIEAGDMVAGSVDFELSNPAYDLGDVDSAFDTWQVKVDLPEDEARQLLEAAMAERNATPFFPSSNTIGGKVAGGTQNVAILALFVSLLGIVAYIWIRFQRVIFGLAAVVALVHDVLFTLGAIALSFYVVDLFGFLGIEEFKISLSVLAAFLTIIGYSLNDTIVVFDRIREVRGKAPAITGEMINTSINQTLSRTLLTSVTTLIVVVILYFGGGPGIHAFAFSLVVGVMVGTYSSIFVASPVLLWMSGGTHMTDSEVAKQSSMRKA